MHRLLNSLLISTCVIVFSSCGETLSSDEKSVIENDLADILYEENMLYQASSLDDYLYEAVDAYLDKCHDEMQSKIDSYNTSASLFGGWDAAELFGSSGPEIFSGLYYRYLNYANDNREKMADLIEEVTRVVVDNPQILDKFEEGETFSLAPFSKIEGLPEYISDDELAIYRDLSLSEANMEEWGEMVMGPLKKPCFSTMAVICATLKALCLVNYPVAVYAIYDEEEKGWIVGYDTEDAYFVKFKTKGDVLEFEYSPHDYQAVYIDSINNKLK